MCTILSIGNAIWEYQEGNSFITFLPRADGANASLSAFLTFWSYVIILNTVVPISLYVRSEVILTYIKSKWSGYLHAYYISSIHGVKNICIYYVIMHFIIMTDSKVKTSETSYKSGILLLLFLYVFLLNFKQFWTK